MPEKPAISENLREHLKKELTYLVERQDWRLLRSWFKYYKSEDERVIKCILWCRFFLGKFFVDPTPPFHYELVRMFLSKENAYVASPRGSSKTTLEQGVISYLAASAEESFIVIIEKSYTEAVEVLSVIRETFTDNPLVLQVYGRLLKTDTAGKEKETAKDTQGDILVNGVRIRAKGFNAPIRGIKSGPFRPSLIFLDDVEDDKHIRNEDQRRKYRENFSQGVLPALDIGGRVKVIGTILHQDSLLKSLIDQHGGEIYRSFDPANPETTLLWPERWTYERLMEKKGEMEMEGFGTNKFYQEYQNEVMDDEYRKFRYEWLEHTFTEASIRGKSCNRFIAIDVADSKNETADWTFVAVVDIDADNNWYVRHAKRKRVNNLELIEWIFELWLYWKPLKMGVEKKSFEFQVQPLLKERSKEKQVFPIVEQLHDGGLAKESRVIGALQGRFESGKILFDAEAKDDTAILKGELYDFPRGKTDDGCDALAYIGAIGQRPFAPNTSYLPKEHQEFYQHRKEAKRHVLTQSLRNL